MVNFMINVETYKNEVEELQGEWQSTTALITLFLLTLVNIGQNTVVYNSLVISNPHSFQLSFEIRILILFIILIPNIILSIDVIRFNVMKPILLFNSIILSNFAFIYILGFKVEGLDYYTSHLDMAFFEIITVLAIIQVGYNIKMQHVKVISSSFFKAAYPTINQAIGLFSKDDFVNFDQISVDEFANIKLLKLSIDSGKLSVDMRSHLATIKLMEDLISPCSDQVSVSIRSKSPKMINVRIGNMDKTISSEVARELEEKLIEARLEMEQDDIFVSDFEIDVDDMSTDDMSTDDKKIKEINSRPLLADPVSYWAIINKK